jgi:hypothetical protein
MRMHVSQAYTQQPSLMYSLYAWENDIVAAGKFVELLLRNNIVAAIAWSNSAVQSLKVPVTCTSLE